MAPRSTRPALSLIFAVVALAACGGDDKPKLALTLGTTYDVIGVMRSLVDGGAPESMHEIYLAIDGVQLSGGRVLGTIGPRSGGGASFTATFSSETGHLDVDQLDAALTSTVSEHVDELGGRGDDILPKDGVVDEITGYLRTSRGTLVEDGTLLAVNRVDGRPAPVEEEKIAIREEDVNHVRVTAQPGAALARAGVEILRFRSSMRTPDLVLVQAKEDGSFDQVVAGIREDVFVLRVRSVGQASDGRFFRVSRE